MNEQRRGNKHTQGELGAGAGGVVGSSTAGSDGFVVIAETTGGRVVESVVGHDSRAAQKHGGQGQDFHII